MNRIKRMISIGAAAAIMLSAVPPTSLAADENSTLGNNAVATDDGKNGSDLSWNVFSDTVTVSNQNPIVESWELVKDIPFNSKESDLYTLALCDDPSVANVTADGNGLTITQVKNDAALTDANKPDIKLNLGSVLTDESGVYYVETEFHSSMTAGNVRMQYSYDNGSNNYGEKALFIAGKNSASVRVGNPQKTMNLSYTNGTDTTVGMEYDMATQKYRVTKNGAYVDESEYQSRYGAAKPLYGIWFRFEGAAGGAGSTYTVKGVKVYKKKIAELTDQEMTDMAAKAITAESIAPNGVITKAMTTPVPLPTTGENGVSISWTSDKPNILDGSGNITRPKIENETVTLTAVFTHGTGITKKDIQVIVEAINPDMTAEEKLQEDMDALTYTVLGAAADGTVSGNLTLPTAGTEFVSKITYTAQPADMINLETGAVTRSQEADTEVTLTARFSLDGVQRTKEFTLTILKQVYATENLSGLNLALNKTASASEAYNSSFGAEKAVDGDSTTTRYASLDSVGNNGKYFMVDFGAPKSFSYVRFREYNSRITGYKIQYSDDGQSWTDTSIGEQKKSYSESNGHVWTTTPVFDTVTARYVRLYLTADHPDGRGLSLWEFEVYCSGKYTNDMFIADTAALTLESILGNNSSGDAITQNLAELPTGLANGANVVWSTSDDSVITADGTVTQGDEADRTVTLTAKITSPRGTMTKTKVFPLTVLKKADDALAVERDTAAVIEKASSLGLTQSGTTRLTKNLAIDEIVAAAVNGSSVVWKSNDETVISNSGTIFADADSDKETTLTCTIQKGSYSEILTYAIKIPAVGNTIEGDLAKNAKATASGKAESGCTADKATDRRYQTKWFTSGSPDTPYLVIDLGSETNVANVILMEAPDGDVYTVKTAEISVSTDNKTFTKVADINGIGENKEVSFAPHSARYIKYAVTEKDKGNTGLFEIIVKYAPNAEDLVKADKEAFVWPYEYLIGKNIELPTKGIFGSTITWKSSNTSLITNDGKVTINDYEDDKGNSVVLTATFEKDGKQATLEINIKVDSKKGKRSTSGSGSGGSGSSGRGSGGSSSGIPINPSSATHGTDTANQGTNTSVFQDVAIGRWSYPYIQALYEKNVISGDAEKRFNPERNLTREQLVKMIMEALKISIEKGSMGFADVDSDQWYADYLYTAWQKGVVKGISETEFGVGQSITRQDMATMIYRAILLNGDQLPADGSLTGFTDESDISDYAKDAIEALVRAGVIDGVDGAFLPDRFATREQCAKVIYMVMTKLQ